jgi:hypothetical protein
MKAPEHWRTPKRGRACKLTLRDGVLECGGAPPLFNSVEQENGEVWKTERRAFTQFLLVVIEDDPGAEGIDKHQTRVDERRRRSVTFQMIRSNNPSAEQRQSQSANNADHPGRKIRTQNIDRR